MNIHNYMINGKKLSKSLESDKLSIQEAASYCIKFTSLLSVNNANICIIL